MFCFYAAEMIQACIFGWVVFTCVFLTFGYVQKDYYCTVYCAVYMYTIGGKNCLILTSYIFNFSKYSQVIISENICTFGSPKKFSHQFCLPKVALQIQYNIVVDICGEFKGFLVFVILGIQPLLLSVMVDQIQSVQPPSVYPEALRRWSVDQSGYLTWLRQLLDKEPL